VRLFVALDLRKEVREAMRELITSLRPNAENARWVSPDGMHITLKFIGHVDAAKAGSIRAALTHSHSSQPVDMHFRGVGFFPNDKRPRVVWCGIEASPNLAQLAAQIERALEPLGIERESRDFAPHLTLARLNPPARADELVRAANELKLRDFGSARETEFHLFESITKPSGAEYKKLATYPFLKEAH
jgi:RNA 2',3'-cyclic 3'-phosphodiesterase